MENNRLLLAKRLLERCESRGVEVLLPIDHVVASELSEEAETQTVDEIPENQMGLDIGEKNHCPLRRANPKGQSRLLERTNGSL